MNDMRTKSILTVPRPGLCDARAWLCEPEENELFPSRTHSDEGTEKSY